MRKTLERWLGPAGGAGQLPVPALINFDLAPGVDATRVEGAVRTVAPEARMIGHSGNLAPLLRSVRVLQWLALSLVMLMAIATSAAVVLAARGALDTHRFTIEVMHGIGATDAQVVRLFQRKIALDAIAGSAAGSVAAALMLLLLGSGGAALAGEIAGRSPLGGLDLVILALLPVAAVVLATLVARAALLAALRQTL
jgi:cell division transport system permease protein